MSVNQRVNQDVIIVGAGISGLTLAFFLEKAGLNVTVLEAANAIGGCIESQEKDGFLLEKGPNSTFFNDTLLQLVSDLELGDQLISPLPAAKKRYLLRSGRGPTQPKTLVAVPNSFLSFLASPILSHRGKVRLLLEPFIKRTNAEDESVRSFMARRLGAEFADEVIAPALAGIWAADIVGLSTRSALSFFWEAEQRHGSFGLAVLRYFRARKATHPARRRNSSQMVSFKRGMSTLCNALALRLQSNTLQLSSSVIRLELEKRGAQVHYVTSGENNDGENSHSLNARFVVLTTPADVTVKLVGALNPLFSAKLQALPYAPLGILHLAFKKSSVKHSLDGFGFLVSPSAGQIVLGAIFNSSIFPDRTPPDANVHLLTCFVGGAMKPLFADVLQQKNESRAIQELSQMIGATMQPQVLSRKYLHRAIPNYPLHHFRTQEMARKLECQYPSLKILANWDSGVSVVDRIEQARKMAGEIG